MPLVVTVLDSTSLEDNIHTVPYDIWIPLMTCPLPASCSSFPVLPCPLFYGITSLSNHNFTNRSSGFHASTLHMPLLGMSFFMFCVQ